MKTRYFQRLEKYPPCLVRLLARHPNGGAMTDQQIAARGCPIDVVRGLSYSVNWNTAAPLMADAFLHACGADPMNYNWVRNTNRLIKPTTPTKWTWLRRSPQWPQLREILSLYALTLKQRTKQ